MNNRKKMKKGNRQLDYYNCKKTEAENQDKAEETKTTIIQELGNKEKPQNRNSSFVVLINIEPVVSLLHFLGDT